MKSGKCRRIFPCIFILTIIQPLPLRYHEAAHGETWYRDAAYSRALDWFTRWFGEPSQY